MIVFLSYKTFSGTTCRTNFLVNILLRWLSIYKTLLAVAFAHHAYVSEHSVSTLISWDLHQKFGLYSKRYPIGADVLFLKKACGSPETARVRANFVAGEFGCNGTSRTDRVGAICDYFRAQMETESSKYFQLFLFIIKLLKNAASITKSLKKILG